MTLVQRLLLLVSAILVILVSVGVYGILVVRDARQTSVEHELAQTLAFVSNGYERFLEQTHSSLLVASLEASRAVADPSVCQALIGSLQDTAFPWLRFNILDARGIVRCSSAPENIGMDQSDFPEVIAARADGHASRGEYAWGLFSRAPSLAMATVWRGPYGESGVTAGVARLDPFVRMLKTLLPESYAAIVADRGGRVVAVEHADANGIGRPLPPSLAPLALSREPAQTAIHWTDGSERLIAYSPATSSHGVFISVGVGKADVMADVWGLTYSAALAPAVIAVGAFLLAWRGGIHFIRRPLCNLAEVALRWRDGDQSARVTLPGRSEIAGLGRVFNAMADAKDESDRELRRLNAELEQRVAARTTELEFANAELESFSYSVSHDLRAPLRAIDGFSHILMEDYGDKLGTEGARVIGVVRNGVTKMEHLIDDILAFSRITRQEVAASDIDMAALVENALHELAPAMAARSIEVRVGPLPHVHGDPQMLQRVWVNLLDNAVKYTGKKQQALIEVDARAEGKEFAFSVKDNGAGFDMASVDKLFGVFQRLHAQEQFSGTGIGLAIIKRIIIRHGGRVWAEGKIGEGAVFGFTLPQLVADHA